MVFMKPEQQRKERFTAYAHMLKERFDNGMLAELQPLNQWVVWRSELIDVRSLIIVALWRILSPA